MKELLSSRTSKSHLSWSKRKAVSKGKNCRAINSWSQTVSAAIRISQWWEIVDCRVAAGLAETGVTFPVSVVCWPAKVLLDRWLALARCSPAEKAQISGNLNGRLLSIATLRTDSSMLMAIYLVKKCLTKWMLCLYPSAAIAQFRLLLAAQFFLVASADHSSHQWFYIAVSSFCLASAQHSITWKER